MELVCFQVVNGQYFLVGVPPTKREFRTLRNFSFKKLGFSVR
ncbi:hypothetical protein [Bacillus mobilis]|nr:hypothetical protein [Bacillus mobilis]MED0957907.1 hypothetical protein [Bacillus mobilis]